MQNEEHGAATSAANVPGAKTNAEDAWLWRYWIRFAVFALVWSSCYVGSEPAAQWLTTGLFRLPADSHLGEAIQFFIYDTIKILLLLAGLIYIIAWLRAALDTERVRNFLAGKRRLPGYCLGALFGSVTPFCSCSSIPLFLGFTTAGIPFGITMAFLITSPLINEIAVVLLWGLLGWKFTLVYIATGLAAGIIGGFFMDAIDAGRWLRPFLLEAMHKKPLMPLMAGMRPRITVQRRHNFAWGETRSIFAKVWLWVVLGVGIGAALHGFVPDNWLALHFGAGEWWTVPAAVLVAIPLYTNVTGIVPIMQSLLLKGLPVGTTLAFCMSAVAASIPEIMLLRQMMTTRLQAVFIAYLWVTFTLAGWLFNSIGGYLIK